MQNFYITSRDAVKSTNSVETCSAATVEFIISLEISVDRFLIGNRSINNASLETELI